MAEGRHLVRVGFNLGVPAFRDKNRQLFGLTVDLRFTTFHLLISGAIAAAVLYFVNELIKNEKPRAEVESVAEPTPITRGA